METNLFNLINKSPEEVEAYLNNVSTRNFIVDVKNLINSSIEKEVIKDTIMKL